MFLVAAAAAVALLADRDTRVITTNSVRSDQFLAAIDTDRPQLCIDRQNVPRGTGGVQLYTGTYGKPSPPLTTVLRDRDGRVLAKSTSSAYVEGTLATLPLPGLTAAVHDATLCVATAGQPVKFAGQPNGFLDAARATVGDIAVPGDLRIQYVQPGTHSLLSQVSTVARRAALFKPSWFGAWTVYAVFALALALVIFSVLMLLRGGASWSARRWLVLVALIAFGNGLAWSLTTPALQVPDETAHYAYVETLAERGMPGKRVGEGAGAYSERFVITAENLANRIVNNNQAKPPWTAGIERTYERRIASLGDRADDANGWTPAGSYSPLYYAPATVPYYVSGGTVLDRLWAVRMFSVLLIALAAAFAFLAAKELVPRPSWCAPVAGLAVALQPMFAHIGSGVQNDSMLIAVAAVVIYLVIRAFKRGLTPWLAAGTGAMLALGYAVKPGMAGFVPAVVVGIAYLTFSARGGPREQRLRAGAAFAGALVAVGLVDLALFGATGSGTASTLVSGSRTQPFTISGAVTYFWQFFLPDLPLMKDWFPGSPPIYHRMFRGFFGVFNHLDTEFAPWVYKLMAAAVLFLFALFVRVVYQQRDRWRQWLPLAVVLGGIVVGTLALVAVTDYLVVIGGAPGFAQGRYLLPCISLFGIFVALAAKGAGERWDRAVGTAAVATLGCYNVIALGFTLSRFYL